jgi:hypothetical protein
MLFWIIALAIGLMPRAQAQQIVGRVIEIRGDWTLNNGQRLSRWQGVPAGGVIRISSPRTSDRITIDAGGEIIASRICSQPGACNRPIRLPHHASASPSLWNTITGWLFGNSDRYARQGSRGGRNNLLEAVALLKDEGLDLSAMFQEMPEGKYDLVIRMLPRDGRKRLGPIPVEWDPDNPSAVSVPTVLTPGLYRFVLSSDADDLSFERDAWALVSTPENYEKVAASFDEAKEITKQWGDQVEPETISSFLRAYLDYLSTQGAK